MAAPDAPTNVKATDGGYVNKVTITWTKSDGADAYHILRDTVDIKTLGDVATWDDETAETGRVYSYAVVAYTGEDGSDASTADTGWARSGGMPEQSAMPQNPDESDRTNTSAIKTKTDNLPADPADQSDVETAITTAHSTTDGKVDTITTNLGDPSGDTLTTIRAKLGDITRSIDLILGSRWDSSGDLGTDIASLLASNPAVLATGTLTTSSTTVPADTGRTESANYWNGCVLIPLTGAAALQPRKIATFTNGTGVMTLERPFLAAPGTVEYVIIPSQTSNHQFMKDIWCADSAVLASLAFSDSAADKDFPNVVIGTAGAVNGLPLGAVIKQVNLILMASALDSSAAANYINAASKTIRIKASGGSWGTDDIVAFTAINADWYTPGSGMSSIGFISATDISSVVTGAGTYNIESNETDRSDAIVVLAASLTLKGVRTGLRIYYEVP